MEKTRHFDFAGFRRFGQIAEMLASGHEPSTSEWDGLFAVPGYSALTQSEFKRETIIDRLRLACLPTRAVERAEWLASGKSSMLTHFVDVLSRWTELENSASRIVSTELESEAVEHGCRLLPLERLVEAGRSLPDCPPVSFLIFAADARGYEPVVVDVAFALDMSERDLMLMLAHEFHHYYRNRLLTFSTAESPNGCVQLLWVLDQIQAEGIADLINVPEQVYGNGSWASGAGSAAYRAAVEEAPLFLMRLDHDLERVGAIVASGRAAHDAEGAARDISSISRALAQALPRAGHPIGYYMASFLERRGRRDELVEGVGDPFAFMELYTREAAASGLSGFSADARAALAWLNERCKK